MFFFRLISAMTRRFRVGEPGSFFPTIRARQRAAVISLCILVGVLLLVFVVGASSESVPPEGAVPAKTTKKAIAQMATPMRAVDEREIWVSRIEKKAEEAREESQQVRRENEFLQSKVDVLEDLFRSQSLTPSPNSVKNVPTQPSASDPFSPVGSAPSKSGFSQEQSPGSAAPIVKKRRRMVRISTTGFSQAAYKTKDMYMPAGTYSKAVILSGVVASTATNAQGNPQPILMRLSDDGNLPRGFKGRVKDAVVIGSCYGDISSERAFCRLETIAWIEPDGRTVEKSVEGWVFGEDGRAGLRGKVVDRSTDVARASFGAGLLSAAANFFKMQSQRSVYPVSPFGQTDALETRDALTGAGAAGAGNALDKLAEFSIKRAEQMQPVILVSSGRVVDIAFRTGVDLSPDVQEVSLAGGQRSESDQDR